MAQKLADEFKVLDGQMKMLDLKPYKIIDQEGNPKEQQLGQAISITKREDADKSVFLGIHMDTVFKENDSFQSSKMIDEDKLNGPGVIDAKGGLAVMLIALQAFEQSEVAKNIGWEILINPDEEIASPGSAPLFQQAAKRNQLGFVYEPALPNGSLISSRKGSGNFTIVARGRASHAGRDFYSGRSAILAISEFIIELNKLNDQQKEITVNIGEIKGGQAVNVVPDLAIAKFNIRFKNIDDQKSIEQKLNQLIETHNQKEGFQFELSGSFLSPPKMLTEKLQTFMNQITDCGKELGLDLTYQSSGGVCDGNKLAAAGLPTIDTLGPVGENMHNANETLFINSLTERAKLTCLFLLKLATNNEFKC